MKKRIALGLVLALTTGLLAGCGGSGGDQPTNAPAGESIKIGGLAPLTGDVAVYGKASTNGAKLAFEEINAKGGVLGQQIEFDVLDEKGDTVEAVNGYNKLMSEEIVALLGDVTSKPTIAVAEAAGQDGIPMITGTATAQAVTTYGDNIFRVCFIDPFQGKTMATFAADNLKLKTAAVLYNTGDDYSTGVAQAFKETAEAKGMTITNYEGYGNDDKDFKTQLTNISKNKPDVVFIPDYYNRVALIATQAKEVGLNAVLMGADGWDGVLGAVDAGNVEALEGAYFCNHYSTEDESEKVQNFITNYNAKYNEQPNAFAALGYDAAYILADAIERAGSTDAEAINAALAETSLECVTGAITFDENGDPIKSVAVIQINEGQYKLFDKVTAK